MLCAILADKLGDARESHRSAASQILADLHYLCPTDIDALIHDAMKGNNARAKDTSMTWLVKVRAPVPSAARAHLLTRPNNR